MVSINGIIQRISSRKVLINFPNLNFYALLYSKTIRILERKDRPSSKENMKKLYIIKFIKYSLIARMLKTNNWSSR